MQQNIGWEEHENNDYQHVTDVSDTNTQQQLIDVLQLHWQHDTATSIVYSVLFHAHWKLICSQKVSSKK